MESYYRGLNNYLFWVFLNKEYNIPQNPILMIYSRAPSARGEEIETWDELEDLIDDDGDTEMRTLADLVAELHGLGLGFRVLRVCFGGFMLA